MAAPKGNKFGPGGARPGSGRKPEAVTRLKQSLSEYVGEAMESFRFCVRLRDDESAEKALRLAAAKEIMDRVFGKPTQGVDVSGEVTGRIVLVRAEGKQ